MLQTLLYKAYKLDLKKKKKKNEKKEAYKLISYLKKKKVQIFIYKLVEAH